tara:strand:+ start:1802 stop:2890 length:1089 start_codon:yes stop_codon:yes gene_type:complete
MSDKEKKPTEKYSLVVKLNRINAENQESDDPKWGNKEEYFSHFRANVKKIPRSLSGKHYKAFSDCVTYGGDTRRVKASYLKMAFKYDELENLCSFPSKENSAGTRYFILTHASKYTYTNNDTKAVFQLNPSIVNKNYQNNALVIDLTELKRLFNDIKVEWKKESNLKQYRQDNEKKVLKILEKANLLELAIKEGVKKLDEMRIYDEDVSLNQETFNMYQLDLHKSFLRSINDDYVEKDYNLWNKIDNVGRYIKIYQNKITYKYMDYVDRDFDLSISDLENAKSYILLTLDDNSDFPKIENRFSWNKENKRYDKVGVYSLPNLTEYFNQVQALTKLKKQIKEQRETMTRKMLLFLNLTGSVLK